jgi:hypothetical protein
MAVFAVRYSFTCPNSNCHKVNAKKITVTTKDQVDARDLAVNGVPCERCGRELPKVIPFGCGYESKLVGPADAKESK